jgi:hypothetical protein
VGRGFPVTPATILRWHRDLVARLVVCCGCNRPTLDSIRGAGFTVAQVRHTALPKAPPFVRPAILGSATVPAAARLPA